MTESNATELSWSALQSIQTPPDLSKRWHPLKRSASDGKTCRHGESQPPFSHKLQTKLDDAKDETGWNWPALQSIQSTPNFIQAVVSTQMVYFQMGTLVGMGNHNLHLAKERQTTFSDAKNAT